MFGQYLFKFYRTVPLCNKKTICYIVNILDRTNGKFNLQIGDGTISPENICLVTHNYVVYYNSAIITKQKYSQNIQIALQALVHAFLIRKR